MAGVFEVYIDKAGEHRFRLKAANGNIILMSEGYKAKISCINGTNSVQKSAVDEKRYEKRESASGTFGFNLKAGNGQVIAVSQSFPTAVERDKGIDSVIKSAPGADVVDLTA